MSSILQKCKNCKHLTLGTQHPDCSQCGRTCADREYCKFCWSEKLYLSARDCADAQLTDLSKEVESERKSIAGNAAVAMGERQFGDVLDQNIRVLETLSNSAVHKFCQQMGLPVARTSRSLMLKNVRKMLALCSAASLGRFIELVSTLPTGKAEQLAGVAPRLEHPSTTRTIVEEMDDMYDYASANRFIAFLVCFILGFLFLLCVKELYQIYKWCRFRPRSVKVESNGPEDLAKLKSYEFIGTLDKYRKEDGTFVYVKGNNIQVAESTQLGSELLTTKNVPSSTLQFFIEDNFIGMAFRYQTYIITALHVADQLEGKEVVIRCPANNKMYTHFFPLTANVEKSSDLLRKGFEGVVKTPFTDTAIIAVPQKIWARLGDPSSVKPAKMADGLSYSVTVFGTTIHAPLEISMARGIAKPEGSHVPHSASTRKGFSGTAGYVGATDVKTPQVGFVHYLGSKSLLQPNSATSFSLIAMWMDTLASRQQEDSEKFFMDFAKKHREEIIEKMERREVVPDPYDSSTFYITINGKMREFASGELDIIQKSSDEDLIKFLKKYDADPDFKLNQDGQEEEDIEQEEKDFHTSKRFSGGDNPFAGEKQECAGTSDDEDDNESDAEDSNELDELRAQIKALLKAQKKTEAKNEKLKESAGKLTVAQKKAAEEKKKLEKEIQLLKQPKADKPDKEKSKPEKASKNKDQKESATPSTEAKAEVKKPVFPAGTAKTPLVPKSKSALGSKK